MELAEKKTDVARALVVVVGGGTYVWIENGIGWTLVGGDWLPLTEAPGIGGWVVRPEELQEIVGRYGRPLEKPPTTTLCIEQEPFTYVIRGERATRVREVEAPRGMWEHFESASLFATKVEALVFAHRYINDPACPHWVAPPAVTP